jgi:hypothetical protein
MDTWHTDAWASPDGGGSWLRTPGEAAWLELERRVASVDDAQVVWNYNPFPSFLGDDLMQNPTTFPDATGRLSNPLLIRQGVYLEPYSSPFGIVVAATPSVARGTVSTPGWTPVASLTGCAGSSGCVVSLFKGPRLGGFLGPESTDALVYQVLDNGRKLAAIRGVVSSGTDGSPVLNTASTVVYGGMRWIDPVSGRQLGNVRLGTAETPYTGFSFYPVFAVDPGRPWHLLAPDSQNGKVVQSFNGGDTWFEVADLTRLVTRDAAGESRFRFTPSYQPTQTIVSAISFFPENPNLVLAGTVENGLFFSADRGANWRRVPGSEHVTNVSAIHWRSANSAVIGSWGRGLFEIAMRHRLSASALAVVCGEACRELRLTSLLSDGGPNRAAVLPEAGPSFDSAVLVLDGRANGAALKEGRLETLWVSPGSNLYLLSGANTVPDFVAKPRSGFAGFEGLPEVDALRDKQQVIKGFGFSAGKLTHVLYDTQETRTPLEPAGQPTLPKATEPFLSEPYLTVSGMGMAVAVGGQNFRLQGWRFDAGTPLLIELDGKVLRQVRTDPQGNFEVRLTAPGAIGRYLLRARQAAGKPPRAAEFEFSVGNRD